MTEETERKEVKLKQNTADDYYYYSRYFINMLLQRICQNSWRGLLEEKKTKQSERGYITSKGGGGGPKNKPKPSLSYFINQPTN